MSYHFLPYAQEQMYLMPPAITEWVAEGSLARFVSEILEELDREGTLASFYDQYREDGWGSAAYHPLMMVKVLVYGYSVGITSSRRLAQALEDQVAFRYLSANQSPDFRTIADFRRRHLTALEGLFVQVLRLCREAGLVTMGRVALDGRKVAANAALDQNRTLAGIEREVHRILEEAERLDQAEDQQYGPAHRGDELPEALRTRAGRLARLQEAKQRLQAEASRAHEAQAQCIRLREQQESETGHKKRGRKPKAPAQVVDHEAKVNLTDPDSRILKTRKGWLQGYNGQAIADCSSQVIVACEVTHEENDVRQLTPMLDRCEAQAGERPHTLIADAGYWSDANAALADETTELFIATTKEWKQRKALRDKGCPRGRIPKHATARDRMERKLLTRVGQAVYKLRSCTIEPGFGQMSRRGVSRFWLRGLQQVQAEWSLWCSTHNLLKLWRAGFVPARVQALASG
jgi:transposase